MIMIHISSLAANFHTASKNYHGPLFQATLSAVFYLAKCVQKIPVEMRFTLFILFILFTIYTTFPRALPF